jgi:hypothetical protein
VVCQGKVKREIWPVGYSEPQWLYSLSQKIRDARPISATSRVFVGAGVAFALVTFKLALAADCFALR